MKLSKQFPVCCVRPCLYPATIKDAGRKWCEEHQEKDKEWREHRELMKLLEGEN